MASLHISLSDQLKTFVASDTKQGGFSNYSDYIRYLIREERKRKQRQIEEKIAQGTESILNTIYKYAYNSTQEKREKTYKKLSEKPFYADKAEDEIMQIALDEIALSRK